MIIFVKYICSINIDNSYVCQALPLDYGGRVREYSLIDKTCSTVYLVRNKNRDPLARSRIFLEFQEGNYINHDVLDSCRILANAR